jgi:hypothetical protein
VILAAGIALAVTQLIPALPSDHELAIDLPTGAGVVRRLDLNWARVGDQNHTGGVRLAVPAKSTKTVHHTLRGPDGPYEIELVVQRRLRGGTLSETSHHRRVNLSSGQTRIVLEPKPQ